MEEMESYYSVLSRILHETFRFIKGNKYEIMKVLLNEANPLAERKQ
jgi:hypothetical protein